MTPGLEVRRAADRFLTEVEGRTTRHSFSFDRHYDPANVGFGFLLCHNDDRIEPGHGYPPHPHRDVEILTWVVEGVLRHEDSLGHVGLVAPGLLQLTSAGTGIVHSEVNDAPGQPLRFVQVWLRPDEPGASPAYAQRRAAPADGWVTLASGLRRYAGTGAAPVRNRHSALHLARLDERGSVVLPDARWLHLFVVTGEVALEGAGTLTDGDAVRLTDGGGQRLTAHGSAQVLLWEMHAPG
jgi:redox-sensitive bicupin YhaK (pirin superfamily)